MNGASVTIRQWLLKGRIDRRKEAEAVLRTLGGAMALSVLQICMHVDSAQALAMTAA